MAGDSFFSKPSANKRKRPGAPSGGSRTGGASRKPAAGGASTSSSRNGAGVPPSAGKGTKKSRRDEELSNDGESDGGVDDMELRRDTRGGESDEEERMREVRETGAEKRLRMAREYLEGLEKEQDDGTYDAAEIDREIMASRLQDDVLSHSPKIHLFPSTKLSRHPKTVFLPISTLPPTSARASSSTPHLYVSSKSGAISKYDIQTGALLAHFPRARKGKGKEKARDHYAQGGELEGHSDQVLDLAISEDGQWLASAGRDGIVGCWDVSGDGGKFVRGLRGHRDAVTALVFRAPTLTLYTTSLDRTISVFSLSTLSHLETLFGHQDASPALSTLRAENLVSAGSRDRTVRFWKIAEESQLVFRGGGVTKGLWEEDEDIEEERERLIKETPKPGEGPSKIERRKKRAAKGKPAYKEGSIDCVAMIDEQNFLSGGDSGAIALWNITKKKPVFMEHLAHGVNEHASESEGVIGTARWITSLACLPYGDTFVSGSWDGSIRVWSIAPTLKSFSLLFTIPAKGFVNSLEIIAPPASQVDFTHWRASRTPADDEDVEQVKAATTAREATTLLVVGAVSQEPRLGRWMTLKEGVRNGVVLAHLVNKRPGEEEEEEVSATVTEEDDTM